MRSIAKLGLLTCLLWVFFLLPQHAVLASERIKSFTSDIIINSDASINVVEEIVYDFGTAIKHGIFRDIPVIYQVENGSKQIELSQINVSSPNNSKVIFTESQSGNLKKIKIGDPNATISGIQTYQISYRAKGVINYFADHDELYWNVTGNGWVVPIDLVRSRISVVGATSSQAISTACYYGSLGSKNQCQATVDSLSEVAATYSSSGLLSGQGMTAVFGFPKGLVANIISSTPNPADFDFAHPSSDIGLILNRPPAPKTEFSPLFTSMIFIFIGLNILMPVVAFVVMYRRWRRLGRDPKVGTIIPQYDAPINFSPALVGVTVSDAPTMESMTGEIINLAILGYLKIRRIKSEGFFSSADYELIKLKPEDIALRPYQAMLFKALFAGAETVKLSSLAGTLVQELDLVGDAVNDEATKMGLYPENPEKVRNKYMTVGGLMLLGVFIGLFGLIPAGIIIMVFGYYMPIKTLAGVQAKEHLLGLKMYLSIAEKDRLEFHNAPEKDPAKFEKLLPYAIALDVTEQWAKKFEGIGQKSPTWYDDPNQPFTPVLFAGSLSTIKQSFASSGTAASGGSGLSGGGHSGGGFGGGGGGSW